jgi:small subunit ribosomal protein S8e
MVQYHKTSRTKQSGSGGKRRESRDKRLDQYGGFFSKTKLGVKEARTAKKMKGGKSHASAKTVSFANVAEGKAVKKAKITGVVESMADRHHARENIITKGTIIMTDLGKCRVTSRPGQHGTVNAVLIEKKAAGAAAAPKKA